MGKEKKRGITPFRHFIKHVGFVDINKVIKTAEDWFKKNKYDFTVKGITHKVRPDGGEVEYKLIAEKNISHYVKFKIECEIWLLRGKHVTMEKEGKTKKGRSGKLEIKVSSTIEKDYEKRFEKNKFSQFLREIYERYIVKDYLAAQEGRTYVYGHDFVNALKGALDSYK